MEAEFALEIVQLLEFFHDGDLLLLPLIITISWILESFLLLSVLPAKQNRASWKMSPIGIGQLINPIQ